MFQLPHDTIILIFKDLSSDDICSITSSSSGLYKIRHSVYVIMELIKRKFKFMTRVDSEEYECIDLYKIYLGINRDNIISHSDKLKVIFDCGYTEIAYQICTRRDYPPLERLNHVLKQSRNLNSPEIFFKYAENNKEELRLANDANSSSPINKLIPYLWNIDVFKFGIKYHNVTNVVIFRHYKDLASFKFRCMQFCDIESFEYISKLRRFRIYIQVPHIIHTVKAGNLQLFKYFVETHDFTDIYGVLRVVSNTNLDFVIYFMSLVCDDKLDHAIRYILRRTCKLDIFEYITSNYEYPAEIKYHVKDLHRKKIKNLKLYGRIRDLYGECNMKKFKIVDLVSDGVLEDFEDYTEDNTVDKFILSEIIKQNKANILRYLVNHEIDYCKWIQKCVKYSIEYFSVDCIIFFVEECGINIFDYRVPHVLRREYNKYRTLQKKCEMEGKGFHANCQKKIDTFDYLISLGYLY